MDQRYILAVDDDPHMHTLLGLLLRPLERDVRYAANGRLALEMVSTTLPALILLDLQMPGMNGFEVLETLSTQPDTSSIPVIVFSANVRLYNAFDYNWPGQVVAVIEKGAVRPADLRDLVESHLDLARPH